MKVIAEAYNKCMEIGLSMLVLTQEDFLKAIIQSFIEIRENVFLSVRI